MLQMMTDLRDEEDWAMEDEVEDVDSDVSFIPDPSTLHYSSSFPCISIVLVLFVISSFMEFIS